MKIYKKRTLKLTKNKNYSNLYCTKNNLISLRKKKKSYKGYKNK